MYHDVFNTFLHSWPLINTSMVYVIKRNEKQLTVPVKYVTYVNRNDRSCIILISKITKSFLHIFFFFFNILTKMKLVSSEILGGIVFFIQIEITAVILEYKPNTVNRSILTRKLEFLWYYIFCHESRCHFFIWTMEELMSSNSNSSQRSTQEKKQFIKNLNHSLYFIFLLNQSYLSKTIHILYLIHFSFFWLGKIK